MMCAQGKGVEQDLGKATRFYQQAHLAGDAEGTCCLGLMNAQSKGVGLDLRKAAQLFQQTHLAGDAVRTRCLGGLYEHAKGVEQDLGKTVQLYQQAHLAEEEAGMHALERSRASVSGNGPQQHASSFGALTVTELNEESASTIPTSSTGSTLPEL